MSAPSPAVDLTVAVDAIEKGIRDLEGDLIQAYSETATLEARIVFLITEHAGEHVGKICNLLLEYHGKEQTTPEDVLHCARYDAAVKMISNNKSPTMPYRYIFNTYLQKAVQRTWDLVAGETYYTDGGSRRTKVMIGNISAGAGLMAVGVDKTYHRCIPNGSDGVQLLSMRELRTRLKDFASHLVSNLMSHKNASIAPTCEKMEKFFESKAACHAPDDAVRTDEKKIQENKGGNTIRKSTRKKRSITKPIPAEEDGSTWENNGSADNERKRSRPIGRPPSAKTSATSPVLGILKNFPPVCKGITIESLRELLPTAHVTEDGRIAMTSIERKVFCNSPYVVAIYHGMLTRYECVVLMAPYKNAFLNLTLMNADAANEDYSIPRKDRLNRSIPSPASQKEERVLRKKGQRSTSIWSKILQTKPAS